MKAYKKKILHLSLHLGGGMGRILTNYLFSNKDKYLSKYSELMS